MRELAGLACTTWGDSSAPPMLLLHGFLGCSADWIEIAQPLARTHFVIAPDLPGHGASAACDDALFQFDGLVQALVSDMGRSQKSWRMLGYSMGGRIALALAHHLQHNVEHVTLISASPGLATEEERAQRRATDAILAQRLRAGRLEQFLRSWYAMPMFGNLCETPGFARMLQRRNQQDLQALAQALQGLGLGEQPSYWECLQDMNLPVRLVCGELDSKFVDIQTQMRKQLPRVDFDVVPACGHAPHLEIGASAIVRSS